MDIKCVVQWMVDEHKLDHTEWKTKHGCQQAAYTLFEESEIHITKRK